MRTHKSLICFLLVAFYFTFIPYGNASSDVPPVNKMWQSYCNFNGLFGSEERWTEEFKMLEEPSDHPNFQTMCDKLSIFIAMPNDFIDNCPNLKRYLSKLVDYHANNKNIIKKVRVILNYIAQNKLATK
jgi:hypothetical protein